MFIINTFSTCFGHHYAHLQENKTCVTARGVLRWFCWMWVVARSLQHGHHSNPAAPNLQHTTKREQNDRCGNSTAQSQAPDHGYINVRNTLIHRKWNKIASDIKLVFYSWTVKFVFKSGQWRKAYRQLQSKTATYFSKNIPFLHNKTSFFSHYSQYVMISNPSDPWSRLTLTQPLRQFPAFSGIQMFITLVKTITLYQMNAVHTLTYFFFDIDLILFFCLGVGLPIYLHSTICLKNKGHRIF